VTPLAVDEDLKDSKLKIKDFERQVVIVRGRLDE
jgi:hypothetical protein